ncbi:MAG: molybdopterin-dependent oxidoreductase [Deltaproteobacteria bacterium]|nr:molybdopterin-dependent oxidoreductase [Deltaproteobacteria bacterium]MBT4637255.1 molybdopterin-dependent oxidoreductase [Deltaproteobacteria bacterium]
MKITVGFATGLGIWLSPGFGLVSTALARIKKIILPKNTIVANLLRKHPRTIDTRNLEITDLKEFQTMGTTLFKVAEKDWRLKIRGKVDSKKNLTYSEITALSSVEKDVLMICPGFFAQHGTWKGLDMGRFLKAVGAGPDVMHITFSGDADKFSSSYRFTMKEVQSGKVFLAYAVNGKPLPKKHGFPLRVVAEDHYGGDWVKYVNKMELEGG